MKTTKAKKMSLPNRTITIAATYKPASGEFTCSRCGGIATSTKLVIVMWNETKFQYCRLCQEKMGI